jgi:hypothetical protein
VFRVRWRSGRVPAMLCVLLLELRKIIPSKEELIIRSVSKPKKG